MQATNSDQYFDLKPKDSEELILSSRLMKEVKFRKRKSNITLVSTSKNRSGDKGIEKQEVLCKDKSGFVTELSYKKNTGTQVKNQIKKLI